MTSSVAEKLVLKPVELSQLLLLSLKLTQLLAIFWCPYRFSVYYVLLYCSVLSYIAFGLVTGGQARSYPLLFKSQY